MDNEMMRGMSPYEHFIMTDKTTRRPNGASVAALVLGSVGTVAAVGAWIFGPVISGNRAKGIEKVIDVTNANTNNTLNRLAGLLDLERSERVAQGTTISQTITDTISGQQQGSQSQSTSVENSAMAQATAQLLTQSLLGNLSENAQKVQIYSAPQPCGCPGCGA